VLLDNVVFFAAITEMQSLLIATGITVQQKLFLDVTSCCKQCLFFVITRKFSNEMRFLVEPLCCNQYT